MARTHARGLDVADALSRCDAFPLLHALGDTVITGPTGTNVRDLRVLVHHG
jgi:hydroxypyruvate reductase